MAYRQQIDDALYRPLAHELGAALRRLKGLEAAVIEFETSKPVAYDSPDYVMPVGTFDFSSSDAFTLLATLWIPVEQLAVLDIGCAGGAMVGDFHRIGCLAVGVEGTDHQKQRGTGNWARLPQNLHTADITVPFDIHLRRPDGARERAQFTLVTSWEVLEHIRDEDLPTVMANIERHLAPGGVIVMSICPISDMHKGVELHQTIRPRDWWMDRLDSLGFENHPAICDYFGMGMVRGGELEVGTPSFHVALTRKGEAPVAAERLQPVDVSTAALGVTREEYGLTHWRVIDLMQRVEALEAKLAER